MCYKKLTHAREDFNLEGLINGFITILSKSLAPVCHKL